MTKPYEQQPYQGEPDDFDMVVGELLPQIEDPYITELHKSVHSFQEAWEDTLDIDPADPHLESVRSDLQDILDKKWRYMGNRIEITGLAQQIDDWSERQFTPRMCIGESVRSEGFLIIAGDPRFYHYFAFIDDQGRKSKKGMIAVDDIQQLTLPEPSSEARIKRFSYYHEESANFLDEIYFEAKRADQVMADLHHFNFYATADNQRTKDDLLDAMEYIRTIAEIDSIANYKLTMIGEFIVINKDGNGVPSNMKMPHAGTVRVNDIVLRPADIRAQGEQHEQPQNWVPFIDVTMLKENGQNVDLMVPCTSIQSMYSLRYNSLPNS